MQITNQSRNYLPGLVEGRFVQRDITSDGYIIAEVSATGRTLREGRLEAHDIPDAIRATADAERYSAVARVPWPIDNSATVPVRRDLLAEIGEGSNPLEQAAVLVLRDALDQVKFKRCGPVDDSVAAEELSPALKALLKALTD
ncbi:TPA: hypothetical protein L5U90_003312 [Pseudomonas aeruginosa]|nr:hypothetical protein [Pseudomonas aeruginosa]